MGPTAVDPKTPPKIPSEIPSHHPTGIKSHKKQVRFQAAPTSLPDCDFRSTAQDTSDIDVAQVYPLDGTDVKNNGRLVLGNPVISEEWLDPGDREAGGNSPGPIIYLVGIRIKGGWTIVIMDVVILVENVTRSWNHNLPGPIILTIGVMNISNLSISSLLRTSLEVESLGTANLPPPTTIPPSPGQPDEDPLPPSPSTLTFTKGRNGGRQARQAQYGGYIYNSSNGKNVKNGNQYWCCKDNRKYDPKCNALGMLKQHCPDLDVETVLVDFEQAEHRALKEHFPDAIPQGQLWDQAYNQAGDCVRGRGQRISGESGATDQECWSAPGGKGNRGVAGPTGIAGIKGIQGPPGTWSANINDCPAGAKGDQGPPGYPGEPGESIQLSGLARRI
eukprot:sb/3479590/